MIKNIIDVIKLKRTILDSDMYFEYTGTTMKIINSFIMVKEFVL